MFKQITAFFVCIFLCLSMGYAQNAENPSLPAEKLTPSNTIVPPKLFLNCASWRCYEDFVRTELNFFDYVRDRFEADIQILIINQDNAAGGSQYTLTFIGQKNWAGKTDTLKFATKQADTDEIIRQKLVRFLKLGLIKYELPTELLDDITVDFKKRAVEQTMVKNDQWNYWVFQLGGQGNVNGGSKYVKSLGEHWSAGAGYVFRRSVFQNFNAMNQISPAVEYNAFKTSENTKHQLRFLYQAGIRTHNYLEPTIFEKSHENLPFQRLDVALNLTRTWGTIGAIVTGFQYLHDASKYRLSFGLDLNWRVFEGFSVNISGNASYVKDQVFLPASAFDPTTILLGARQLPSSFDYWTYFGVSYTFGSINNSVVNPRFNDY
ncbi:MAG: hypothetical protein EAZ95_18420 [Bacteroidetes bacterium]|nr:MAG: hypothetical protein EAZ95_18420 [Bacteroidota bacterium]